MVRLVVFKESLLLKNIFREFHANILGFVGRESFRQSLKQAPNRIDEWTKLFRGIPDQSYMYSSDAWPLSLDPSFQILIGSYLGNQPENFSRLPSLTMIRGVVKELCHVFSASDTLAKFVEGAPKALPLLSLDYSRLLLVSFSKIETNDQKDALQTILNSLLLFLNGEGNSAVCAEVAVGEFIAQVITLCFSAYVVVRFPHDTISFMREEFKFGAASPLKEDQDYIGLFIANSFRLPLLDVDALVPDDLSLSKTLQAVLENAFRIGISKEQIRKDEHLNLAFASYNGLSQSFLWSTVNQQIDRRISVDETMLHLVVFQLRSDMCLLNVKCKKFKKLPAGRSTMERLMMMRLPNITIQTLRNDIKGLLGKSAIVIEWMMSSIDDEASGPIAMVALESALSCMAFALSCCTGTKSREAVDILSILSERRRKDSIESDDQAISDGLSITSQGSSPPSDGIERLRHIVSTISSAPCHPDWLDQSYTLLVGLDPDDIAKETSTALKSFRKVVEFSMNQIRSTRKRSLKQHMSSLNDEDVSLLEDLLSWQEQAGHTCQCFMSDDDCSLCDFLSAVGSAFDCPDTFLRKLSLAGVSSVVTPHELLALKCSHLTEDDINDSVRLPYLRATGKWEAVLSLALVGPLRKTEVDDNEDVGWHSLQIWSALQEHTLSNMIPAAALYRLTLAREGRGQHPLVQCDAAGPILHESFFGKPVIDNGFPIRNNEKQTKRPVIAHGILELLSELPLSNTSRSISNHLMQKQTDFLLLDETSWIALSFKVLAALNSRANGSPVGKSMDYIARDVVKSSNKAVATVLGALSPISPTVVDIRPSCVIQNMPKPKYAIVQYLLDEMSGNGRYPSADRRKIASQLLSAALSFEGRQETTLLLNVVVELLSKYNLDDLVNLVKVGLCGSNHASSALRSELNTMFGRIFSTRSTATKEMASHLWPIVEESLNDLCTSSIAAQESIVCVAILCSLQCNKLFEFGSLLMSRVMLTADHDQDKQKCRHMQIFCSFVAGLSHVLNKTEAGHEKNVAVIPEKADGPVSRLPKSCTYLADNDFRDQHWYNCGTCGLVGDKGCCSLCSVVCHAGHDVWYSRYGSFLCDCGEMTTNCFGQEQPPMRCLCLVQQARDKYKVHGQDSESEAMGASESNGILTVTKSLQFLNLTELRRKEYLESFDIFKKKVSTSGWAKTFLDMATKALHRWQNVGSQESSTRNCHSTAREGLSRNEGDPFLNRAQPTLGFTPCKFSKALSTIRQSVAYNRKGNLAVAEAGFLSLFGWHLMTDNSETMVPSPVALSKIPTSTAVAGLAFSPYDDKCLLHWGDSCVLVGFIDDTWKSFKKVLRITDFSESDKVDNLIGCSWIHEGHLLVWTSLTISLFQVRADSDSLSPIQKIGLTVPSQDVEVIWDSLPDLHCVFVALVDGTITKLELKQDASSTLYLLETASEPLIDETPCRALTYIQDGRILVYEASGEGVFTTEVGNDLKFGSRKILLPPKLDILGKEKRLGAPYSSIRYLGLTHDNRGCAFHTICCSATKLSRKGRWEQLIVVRFNNENVLIEECGEQINETVGLAACSFPDMKQYSENIIIAAATSAGEIQFSVGITGNYILSNLQPTVVAQRMQRRRPYDAFRSDLLAFEDMRNATACPSIQFRVSDSVL